MYVIINSVLFLATFNAANKAVKKAANGQNVSSNVDTDLEKPRIKRKPIKYLNTESEDSECNSPNLLKKSKVYSTYDSDSDQSYSNNQSKAKNPKTKIPAPNNIRDKYNSLEKKYISVKNCENDIQSVQVTSKSRVSLSPFSEISNNKEIAGKCLF